MIDWGKVQQALNAHNDGDSDTGAILLLSALNAPGGPSVSPTGQATDWGKDGKTGEGDPRAYSADHHGPGAIHLIVHERPDRPMKLVKVEAFGPDDKRGGGRHTAVVTQGGESYTAVLGTGYHGVAGEYDQEILHAPGQEVVITAKFMPPNNGPLGIYLVDGNNNPVSDEVGNLGLPGGLHFAFALTFARR